MWAAVRSAVAPVQPLPSQRQAIDAPSTLATAHRQVVSLARTYDRPRSAHDHSHRGRRRVEVEDRDRASPVHRDPASRAPRERAGPMAVPARLAARTGGGRSQLSRSGASTASAGASCGTGPGRRMVVCSHALICGTSAATARMVVHAGETRPWQFTTRVSPLQRGSRAGPPTKWCPR